MKKLFKNQIAVAIIIGAFILALGIVGYALINKSSGSGSKSVLDTLMNEDKTFQGAELRDDEYILGSTKNDITLVVYTDFECPFCKRLHEDALAKLLKKYSLSDTDFTKGKIGIVYRHLPYQAQSPVEISAAMCVSDLYGHSAYVNLINAIFEKVPLDGNLDVYSLPGIAKDAVNLAKENGQAVKKDFNEEEFTACYMSDTYESVMMAHVEEAAAVGVEGTPHSLILYKEKGKQIVVGRVSGAREVSLFETIIDRLLKL